MFLVSKNVKNVSTVIVCYEIKRSAPARISSVYPYFNFGLNVFAGKSSSYYKIFLKKLITWNPYFLN